MDDCTMLVIQRVSFVSPRQAIFDSVLRTTLNALCSLHKVVPPLPHLPYQNLSIDRKVLIAIPLRSISGTLVVHGYCL